MGIDQTSCIRCGECVKECPANLFSEKETEKEIKFEDSHNICILCGHCIAVCPTNAVIAADIDELYEFEEVKNPQTIISYENLIKMIRARRSIRRFTNTPIPRDTIEKVLQALRYAPSASNAQSWNYIVLTDPPQIKSFTDKVMNVIYLLRKILKFKSILRFFVSGGTKQVLLDPRTLIKVNRMIADYEAGQDVIFYNAPCVIILHAPKYGGMAGVDAGVALTHGIFAAQSLNIGTCWVGYAQEAIQRIKKLRKWLQIPKKRNCYGVLALGYPAVKYQRSPPRKVLQVQWID